MARGEAERIAEMLVRSHGGKAMFNLGDAAKILGQGRNSVPRYLHESGVLVKKVGQEKMVSALQLAEFMCAGRIAPVDGTSRGLVTGIDYNPGQAGAAGERR